MTLKEKTMTIHFSTARKLLGAEKPIRAGSSLVLRVIQAQNDPAKRRVRDYLLAQTDKRLKENLGFSDADLHVLRSGYRAGRLAIGPWSIALWLAWISLALARRVTRSK
jgi:hypothetical protein